MVPRQSTISGSRSGLSIMTGDLADQFSANSGPIERLHPSVPLRRARSRPLTQFERQQCALAARQARRQWSLPHRLGFALTTLIWRTVAHLESHQRKYPSQSPSLNGPSFCSQKTTFLWHLVTKLAKNCWAALGVDGLVRDIGPESCRYIKRDFMSTKK